MLDTYLKVQPNGQPSISHRLNISWLPIESTDSKFPPATEDSAVVVLSSRPYIPKSSESDPEALAVLMYVDLRLSLPLSPSSTIKWAFAGIRHTLRTGPHPRYRWDHFVDSHPSAVEDVGETVLMRDQETGLEKEVEAGVGVNPETGREERYFEAWREESLSSGDSYIFLTNAKNPQESTAFIAVLGPHAIALESSPTSIAQAFNAIRMARQSNPPSVPGTTWTVVFSTPSSSADAGLETELSTILHGLDDHTGSRRRGDELKFLSGKTWTVFDCGQIKQ